MVVTYSIRKNENLFELWFVEYFFERDELIVIRDFKVFESNDFNVVRSKKLQYLNEGVFI